MKANSSRAMWVATSAIGLGLVVSGVTYAQTVNASPTNDENVPAVEEPAGGVDGTESVDDTQDDMAYPDSVSADDADDDGSVSPISPVSPEDDESDDEGSPASAPSPVSAEDADDEDDDL